MSENEINKGKIYVAYITTLGIPELTYALAYVVDATSASGVKVVADHTSSSIGWAKQDIRNVSHLEKYKEIFPQGYEMIDLDEFKIHCRVGIDLCADLVIDEVRKAAGLKDQTPNLEEKKEMSEQKTHAELVSEMRRHGQYNIDEEKGKPVYGILTVEGNIIKDFADQLDAAHKREVDDLRQQRDVFGKRAEKLLEECDELRKQVGNAAKLREAASYLASIFDCDIKFLETHAKELRDTGAYGGGIVEHLLHSITLARAALSAPPRNCDVGTAEEQFARFVEFCHANVDMAGNCRTTCLFAGRGNCRDRAECYSKWAQLPYEGEANQ